MLKIPKEILTGPYTGGTKTLIKNISAAYIFMANWQSFHDCESAVKKSLVGASGEKGKFGR